MNDIGYLGRKLYLAWDKNIVLAIEKLAIDPASLGLQLNGNSGKLCKLYDIYDCMGQRMEREVGYPTSPPPPGLKFGDYLTWNEAWTNEEFDKLHKGEQL